METNLSESDLKRIKDGYQFKDEKFYLKWRRYMDMIAQVHSVVLTQKDTYVLRCWRGTKFGPPNKALEVESRLFRVKKEYFKQYVVPPEPRIANAVEKMGRESLLEIVVYDEHVAVLNEIKSGDYVALQNVHGFVSGNQAHTLTIHGGDGMSRNRGISIIPVDFNQPEFLAFKARITSVLENAIDGQLLPQKNSEAIDKNAGEGSEKMEKYDMSEKISSAKPEKRVASKDPPVKCKNIRLDHIGFTRSGGTNHGKETKKPSDQSSPRFIWKTEAEQELDPIVHGESSEKNQQEKSQE